MAIKKVTVSYGRTIQVRQYEPIRLSVSIEKDMDGATNVLEEVDKSADSLQAYVDAKLDSMVKAIRAKY